MTDAVAVAAPRTASRTARVASLLPGLSAFAVVVGLGIADGGFFATAWGPLTLVWGKVSLGVGALVLPGLLAVLAIWILASASWGSQTEAVPEVQRALAYVTGGLVLALVLRRDTVPGFLIGLWAGIAVVCVYSVATRLFPEELGVFDPIAGYRLSEPLGYWNALGIFSAFGLLLAFGLAARAERLTVRAVAAASTVPLLLTLYFTFSRGAWIALGGALAAMLVLDPRRLQLGATLALVAPWPAAAVLLASTSDPLTDVGSTIDEAAADGRVLTAVGVGLALAAAAASVLAVALEPRARLSDGGRRVGNVVVVGAVVGLIALTIAALGGPTGIAEAFAAEPPKEGTDLDNRLFSLSGSGRVEHWRVAWDVVEDHPALGSGAGSFQRYWLEHRSYYGDVEDAHNLWLEVLSELGPVGLVLVLAVFGLPLVLAVRVRSQPLVPVAAGVLVAFVLHAGIDWDWEFPLLTLVALGCGSAIVASGIETSGTPGTWRRIGLIAAAVALVPLVAAGALGARAVEASEDAFRERDFSRAVAEARNAEDLMPWSVRPLLLLGRAQAASDQDADARATFRRALEREPESWRLWLELAAVSSGAEREAAVARAKALNPLEQHVLELEQNG
jgi:hypothetical protein